MFAGHGKYASRWMGDNYSTQQSMGFSVNGIMQHNIMGVPLVGADVCGFNLDTTPELCARWYGLASFYTWSRNHDEIHSISQEPYLFATDIYEGSITILDIIRKAMWTKFIFVKYMYSSLLDLSMNGGTLHRPLFFEFDHDEDSYRASSELNFMLGDRIKISVNSNMLDRNQTEFYFPEGNWCNLLIANGTNTCMRSLVGGHNITLRTKAYDVYAHLREASIVVLQDGKSLVMENGVRTTEDLNSHPVEMHINPNCFGPFCRASGTWNNDDGRVFDNTDKMNSYNFTMDSLDRTGFVLFFEHLAQATYYDNNVINNNDLLKFIRIHNAAAYIFDTNFTVVVTLLNDSVVNYHDATYNSEWDTLEFENTEVKDPIWMPNVKSIKFTRK
jgi:alpha-glucosidase (family GH31 glycosyl hydrolase)